MKCSNCKLNELEMSLKIAMRAVNHLIEQKPKGGLVIHKGEPTESKMSYQEALLCLQRIERMFHLRGASSFGVCGGCSKWNPSGHNTGDYEDMGTCTATQKFTHRYESCGNHSKENGGWGL